jgi:Ni/Fe-hydrogenase 1 B-type cytochrome subunit
MLDEEESIMAAPILDESQQASRDEEIPSGERVTVFVWDRVVRIVHWLNVLSILVLSITGYYISNPYITTPNDQNLMGLMRFAHFVTAFVFVAANLFRGYWWLVGSNIDYARWPQYLPFARGRRRNIPKMLGYYLFFRSKPPAQIGHNPLAGMTYVAIYILFILQAATGFALYSQIYHGGLWPTMFGWLITIFGASYVRLIHDLLMYVIIAFTVFHVYIGILIDMEERSGLMASIVTGFKSLPPEHIIEAVISDTDNGERKRNLFPKWLRRQKREPHA